MPDTFFMRAARYRWITIIFSISALMVVGGVSWAYGALSRIGSPYLVLHVDDLRGITQIGGVHLILGAGIFGLLAVGMNYAIALEFAARKLFWGKIMAGMTLLFAALLFIAFAAIINLN